MVTDKGELRRLVRQARRERRALPGRRSRDAELLAETWATWLLERYGAQPGGLTGRTVTAYDPMPTEPPVGAAVEWMLSLGVRVLLPVTEKHRRLSWVERGADPQQPALSVDSCGPVLDRVDVALVPGLAVDWHGARLGQGGGYYDRVLPRWRAADVPVLVVLHDDEVLKQVPTEAHDAPVDGWLTPTQVRLLTEPA